MGARYYRENPIKNALSAREVELLWEAADRARLSDQQKTNLAADSPWNHEGDVAQRLQTAVAELAPEQARVWISESGRRMSLGAASASLELTPMTPQYQAEINRMSPQMQDEKVSAEVQQILSQGNPYQQKQSYGENGEVTPAPFNLTNIMRLEQIAPKEAARLKAEAAPEQPAHNFSAREQSILAAHGCAVPQQSTPSN